jgi:hypothetical protein
MRYTCQRYGAIQQEFIGEDELIAPAETTTMSALNVSGCPSRSATTRVTVLPDLLVSSFVTFALVTNVTFECSSAGLTHMM